MKNINRKVNLPVYMFLGYKLVEAHYTRKDEKSIEKFGFKILNSSLVDDIYTLVVQCNIQFLDNEESVFIFSSGFEINDFDWYQQLKNDVINQLFLSVVFPYIREKIHSITFDTREAVDIPTLDLRNVDLSKGVTYYKKNN